MKQTIAALLLIVFLGPACLAAAKREQVPQFDMVSTCRAAGAYAGSNKELAYRGCIKDENDARTELARKWTQFKVEDRNDCIAQGAAPMPSYVEILTCLEISAEAAALYTPGGAIREQPQGGTAPGSQGKSQAAPPAQTPAPPIDLPAPLEPLPNSGNAEQN